MVTVHNKGLPSCISGRDSVQALRIPYRISQLLTVIIKKTLLVLSSRVNLKLRSQHQTRVKSKKKLMKKLVQVRMSHGKEQACRLVILILQKLPKQHHPGMVTGKIMR
uniref:Uncharacterized protein n=1 Tax=Populus davidiana TaxID=266767 RepID=A0A6M2FAC7_9ROSI